MRARVDHRLWLHRDHFNETALRGSLVWEEGGESTPLYTVEGDWIQVPRALAGLLKSPPPQLELEDLRPSSYPRTALHSLIQLDHIHLPPQGWVPSGGDMQQRAFAALSSGLDGGLALYCGAGKTVIAAHYLASLGRPTLVVVDNEALLEQWQRECRTLLRYSPDQEGLWKGAREQWQRSLVFTTYQTLAARAEDLTEEQRRHFGLIIYDEGHHLGARTFHRAAGAFCGQRINLSATPEREDGLDVVTRWHIGPSLYTDLRSPLVTRNTFFKTGCNPREQGGKTDNEEAHLARLAAASSCDRSRAQKIATLLRRRAEQGHRQLVLTRSLTAMANLAAAYLGVPAPYLSPLPDESGRPAVLKALMAGTDQVGFLTAEVGREHFAVQGSHATVFSILKYGREGFNQPALDTVVLDGPVSDPGLLQQVMGRPTRPYPGKPAPELLVLLDACPTHTKIGKKMQATLRAWPSDKGGPFTYTEETL